MNRSLGNMLRALVGDNIRACESRLCQAEFAHNHAVNRSSGFSPFQVVYGIVPGCPLDLAPLPDKTRLHGKASEFVSSLQETHKFVAQNLELSAQKYKARADLRQREVIFNPGDLVWVVLTKDRLPAHEYKSCVLTRLAPFVSCKESTKMLIDLSYRITSSQLTSSTLSTSPSLWVTTTIKIRRRIFSNLGRPDAAHLHLHSLCAPTRHAHGGNRLVQMVLGFYIYLLVFISIFRISDLSLVVFIIILVVGI